MNNAELIAALRYCPSHGCASCPSCDANGRCLQHGVVGLMHNAADTIEAQQKTLEDCAAQFVKLTTRITELESQMPKDGKWIDMGDFAMCSVCKIAQRKKYRQYYGGFMWEREDFCPKCGSRMRKGEQE